MAAAACLAGSMLRRVGSEQEVRSGSGGAAAAKSGGRAASPVRFSALESDGEESDEDFEAEYCETADEDSCFQVTTSTTR